MDLFIILTSVFVPIVQLNSIGFDDVSFLQLPLLHDASYNTTQRKSHGVNGDNSPHLHEIVHPETFTALVHSPRGIVGPSPLLLFLHGAELMGSNISDLLAPKAAGYPPKLLVDEQAPAELKDSFVLVVPQTNHGWVKDEVVSFTKFLLSSSSGLSIDQGRLYLVGHSMGAGAVLEAATTGIYAAIAAMSPCDAPASAELAGVPVWAFHAKNDAVCNYSLSVSLISSLRADGADADHARLTLFEEAPAAFGIPERAGHGSYFLALKMKELYTWLLGWKNYP